MELTIKVLFKSGTGIEMERNLNKAIDELSKVLTKRGVSEMELIGDNFDTSESMYSVVISESETLKSK